MGTTKVPVGSFLEDILRKHRLSSNRLAHELGVSHVTLRRWLSGEDNPSIRSCQKIARYCGESLESVLRLVGHIPGVMEASCNLPEFREYARSKYPDELDEDLIAMIEDLIERRRAKRYAAKHVKMGK
jgi:transcriptional regulator with XRE-family HTH domain